MFAFLLTQRRKQTFLTLHVRRYRILDQFETLFG